jgi:Icc-related predicted phosphoesterase
MRLVLISDTHCRLSKIDIPEGDVLLHAGDLTFQGNIQEVSQEAHQLEKIKHRFTHGIVFIPGNHDWGFQRNEALFRQIMGNTKVLIDESITIESFKIFGSPYQPEFCNWSFNLPRGQALQEKWAMIPDDTNILITHGPPYGILDQCPDGRKVGCEELYKRVIELKNLKLHVFGHIHHSYNSMKFNNTWFVNASICTEQYKPQNKPIIINI